MARVAIMTILKDEQIHVWLLWIFDEHFAMRLSSHLLTCSSQKNQGKPNISPLSSTTILVGGAITILKNMISSMGLG